MNYRLFQPSPQASTRAIRPRVVWLRAIPEYCGASGSSRDGLLQEKSFLQSWFEDDSVSESGESARTNWGAISGMVLSFAISASFWVGMGLIVERIWK